MTVIGIIGIAVLTVACLVAVAAAFVLAVLLLVERWHPAVMDGERSETNVVEGVRTVE